MQLLQGCAALGASQQTRLLFIRNRPLNPPCPWQAGGLGVQCSSRRKGGMRGTLWRGRILSSEALRAVTELKRYQSDPQPVLDTKVARLLKTDMLAALQELLRQNECRLALKVVDMIKKESWYKPDITFYHELITALSRNKYAQEVEAMKNRLPEEGLKPDFKIYTEVMNAYLLVGMSQEAMRVFEETKSLGLRLPENVYSVLVTGLKKNGEIELAAAVRAEFKEWLLVENASQLPIS